jgi:hypothetical protein
MLAEANSVAKSFAGSGAKPERKLQVGSAKSKN